MEVVVRATVPELGMPLRYHAERRVRLELARFTCQLGKITVLIEEAGNPNGESRTRCFITAEISPHGLVLVDHSGAEPYLTVTQAIQRLALEIQQRDREEQNSEVLTIENESGVLTAN